MAELQTFRTAFNGFNREDVVRYIEYINTRHNDQVTQLNVEIEELRAQLSQAQSEPVKDEAMELRLEQAESRCAELEAELAEANAMLEEALADRQTSQTTAADELEAYRRAERAERMARDRAELLCNQANAALAEATTLVDHAASQLGDMANNIAAEMNAFRDAVIGTKSVLADAAAAMYAVKPCDNSEED